MGAECRREIKQLRQINSQRAAFNFGNGASRGVMPTRKLQGARQVVLRPAMLVAQLGNLAPDEISLLHCQTGFKIQMSNCSFSQNLPWLKQVSVLPKLSIGIPDNTSWETYFPRCGKTVRREVGGHQTDSKPGLSSRQ